MISSDGHSAWSVALFELALEKKELKKYVKDLNHMDEIFEENPPILAIFKSAKITAKQKEKMLNDLFPQIDPLMANFVKLLIDKKLLTWFNKIIFFFNDIAFEHLKIEKGIIYSVNKLITAKIKKFEKAFSQKIGIKVKFINKINKELIAGVSIHINGFVYENSISYQIQSMKEQLLQGEKNG